MRETSFRAQDHPETVPSGASVLVDPSAMNDLVRRLQQGDPIRGWEGDPRLALAWNRADQAWELWRRENDDEYRLVARSKPGLPFPTTLIDELVSHDTRRGFDAVAAVEAHNAAQDKANEDRLSEAMGPIYEKMAYALRQDAKTGAGI